MASNRNESFTLLSIHAHGSSVVTCLKFHEGKIITASDDPSESINVFSLPTLQLLHRFEGHQGGVWSLEAFENTIISGSTDQTVRLWDLSTGRSTHIFGGHISTVRCLALVKPEHVENQDGLLTWPEQPLIVTGSRDATLRVWRIPQAGEPEYRCHKPDESDLGDPTEYNPEENPYHLRCLRGHEAPIRAIAARGRTVVSGSYDHTLRVWDIETGTCTWVLTGHSGKVYSLALDLDHHQVFSGSMDGTIRCWDINNGNCKSVMQGHTSLVGLLSLSSSYLVSGSADAVVFVWNPSTQELCHKFTGHKGAVTALHNSDLRVISGDESALSLWNVKDGSDLINLSLPDMEGVWQVALEGNWCAAAVHGRSVGTQLAVWDLSDSHDDRETFV